jgi:aldose sugar dehydrogenase
MLTLRFASLLLIVFLTNLTLAADAPSDPFANPPSPAFASQTAAPQAQQTNISMELVLSGLQGSRALVGLPDNSVLVAEGSGNISIIHPDGSAAGPISGMPPMRSGEGRILMDIAADAYFAQNRRIFFAYEAAAPSAAADPIEQVASGILSRDMTRFENIQILGNYPGRRLASTSDGKLYITTIGYFERRSEVMDLTTYTGKVLRINADGSIPDDNPYVGHVNVRPEIYAIGHRDQDGVLIHPETGELWTIEHGPMGGDELNVVRPGQNYGWPYVTYGKNYDGSEIGPTEWDGVTQPLYYWFPSLAPSGLAMVQQDLFPGWQGSLLVGSLSPTQGRFLIRLVMDGERVVAEEHLLTGYDRRVRDVVETTDGYIYVLMDSENNAEAGRVFAGEVLKLMPR